MYRVLFYKDKKGCSPVADYIRELAAQSGKDKKDAENSAA